jgi:hypothetical protein
MPHMGLNEQEKTMCDTNWYVVRRQYQDIAKLDWQDGIIDKSEDGRYTYAAETADSSNYVTYYSYQRELWADSQDIRDYEQDAIDCGLAGVAAIQQYCVYMALQDAIRETLDELWEEEAVDYVTVGTKNYYSELAGHMFIPALVIDKHLEGE